MNNNLFLLYIQIGYESGDGYDPEQDLAVDSWLHDNFVKKQLKDKMKRKALLNK
eukprot:Pgem_evm1s4594